MLPRRTGVRFFAAFLLASSALWGIGCDGDGGVVGLRRPAAATIDGEELAYEAFHRYASQSLAMDPEGSDGPSGASEEDAASDDGDNDADDTKNLVWSALFDQFLDAQLLIRLAIERGLVEGEVDETRAIQYLLRDAVAPPDRREIEAYYRSRQKDFERPERVRLRQILVEDRDTARRAQEALLAGEPFVDVAARVSQGPTAHLGGDQGILSRDDLPARFVELIFSLEPGEISGIVDSDYGFQIFQVEERLAAEVIPLESALPVIREELERRSVGEQMEILLSEARERYHVVVYPKHIPFDYRGSYALHPAE